MAKIVCPCYGLEEDRIRQLIRKRKISKLEELMDKTGAGQACAGCIVEIAKILDEEQE